MKAEKKFAVRADRKELEEIHVAELTSLSSYGVIAKEAIITDASHSGFLMLLDRKALVPKEYRDSLSLNKLVGHQVVMYLPQMNLDLDGTVTRAEHRGKGQFEIAVRFSDETPAYWRECLVDLLPAPGEMVTEDEKP